MLKKTPLDSKLSGFEALKNLYMQEFCHTLAVAAFNRMKFWITFAIELSENFESRPVYRFESFCDWHLKFVTTKVPPYECRGTSLIFDTQLKHFCVY